MRALCLISLKLRMTILCGCSILAAYDLGAPATHLKKIYADEAASQRPRILDEKDKTISVNKENWAQYLGNQR